MRTRLTITAVSAIALFGAVAAIGSDGRSAPVPTNPGVPISYLVDLSSGQVLHASEADRRFIPASITKAMTLFLAFEMVDAGELSVTQRFTMDAATFDEWDRKGSTMFIPSGASVSVDNLLRGIATVSANDASILLAKNAAGSVDGWVERMNAAARELGMDNSHFGTPNGWPDEGRTFTTAEDLAKLARAMTVRHPELYRRYIGLPGLRYNGIAQDNRDPITGRVAGADGIKTGYTNQAGSGFLGSAVRGGRRLVMVVAAADGARERDDLARALMEWGFTAHDSKPLFAPGEEIARAMVQDGTSSAVGLRAGGPVNATVPAGQGGQVRLTLHYEGPIRAPIEAGERVAELEIAVGKLPPSRVPLYAMQPVGKARGLRRLQNGFAGLLR